VSVPSPMPVLPSPPDQRTFHPGGTYSGPAVLVYDPCHAPDILGEGSAAPCAAASDVEPSVCAFEAISLPGFAHAMAHMAT
jgi:hypothetical protein